MKNIVLIALSLLTIISWTMFYVKASDAERNKKVIYFSKVVTNVKVRDDRFKRCKEGNSVFTVSHGVRTKYHCKNYTIFVDQKSERIEVEVETSR